MNVIIAAGGTGGHLYPGVALAREFQRQEPGSEIVFLGTARGLEMKVVPREGFELVTIHAKGIMGKSLLGRLKGLGVIPVGLAQCLALCRKRRPDLAFGIGGYTSPPLIMAATLLGITRTILEPNAYPGAANRLLSPLAHRVFVSFAETMPYFGSDKVRIVGTPIRREFLEGVGAEVHMPPDAGPTLLVLGGSQGARSVNRAVVAAMPVLTARYPGLHIIHQTGERDYAEVKDNYTNVVRDENLEVVPFLYDVANVFRRADLLISRSGATTVAEITACGKPAIFIPFPHAIYGHQERNAHVLEHAGAAAVILEAELTGDTLAQTILSLIADRPRLAEMARRSRSLGRSDSAEQIVTMCRQLVAGAAA